MIASFLTIPPHPKIPVQTIYLLPLSLESKRRISKYNHTIVTSKPNAPYHSMYFGAPASAPLSIISKSRIRLSAAMATTNKENKIPKVVPWDRNETLILNIPNIKVIK